MPTQTFEADGSAELDREPVLELDLDDELQRWRYGCEYGDRDWTPTNGGIWCATCARNPTIDDPHYANLKDLRTGELVPWSRVEIA